MSADQLHNQLSSGCEWRQHPARFKFDWPQTILSLRAILHEYTECRRARDVYVCVCDGAGCNLSASWTHCGFKCLCMYTVRALQHDLASIHLPPSPPPTQILYGPTVSRDAFNLTLLSYLAHILAWMALSLVSAPQTVRQVVSAELFSRRWKPWVTASIRFFLVIRGWRQQILRQFGPGQIGHYHILRSIQVRPVSMSSLHFQTSK